MGTPAGRRTAHTRRTLRWRAACLSAALPLGLVLATGAPLAAGAQGRPGVAAGGTFGGADPPVRSTGVSPHQGIVPPDDPSANILPVTPFLCADGTATIDNSPGCISSALTNLDRARGREGLGPIALPGNWAALPAAQQLFDVFNAERTSRGLPPFRSLNANASADALDGAATSSFPPEAGSWDFEPQAVMWAGDVGSALWVDYELMYEDGCNPPVGNLDCAEHRPGWGERNAILGDYGAYAPEAGIAETVAGRGAVYTKDSWGIEFGIGFNYAALVPTPDQEGYWLVTNGGKVVPFGDARFYGEVTGPLNDPIVAMAATPDGRGYWLLGGDGGVFSFGDARFYGSTGNIHLNEPALGMASTPDGRGYWFVAGDGGIFSFGDARFYGSMGGRPLNQPVVGMALDAKTGGYWLVAADGGVFSFHAAFHGSTGNLHLARPIVGMGAAPDGSGYRFVATDGGVFSFGEPFEGSMGGKALSAPVTAMGARARTGYWLLGLDGVVYAFGSAHDYGNGPSWRSL